MTAIADLTGADLTQLYRRGAVSPVEVARDCLARIGLHAALNAFAVIAAESALTQAASIGGALARGAPARRRRRSAGHHQGQCPGQGPAQPARREDERPKCGYRRRTGRGAATRARRRHPRQDVSARARLDRRLPQPAHRHHAQSVESGPHAGRLNRRRRGGGAARPRRAASRHRRRRLVAHSGGVYRRRRHEAEFRPGAGLSRLRCSTCLRIRGRSPAPSPMPC